MKVEVRWHNLDAPNQIDLNQANMALNVDEEGRCHDSSLGKLFSDYPDNTDCDRVIVKVSALNDFYRTRILKTYSVANLIARMDGLDDMLRRGCASAVAMVRKCGQDRDNYSFATKYCHFHNPDAYQIYDRNVDVILRHFRKTGKIPTFKNNDLKDYCKYISIVDSMVKQYCLVGNRKQIDKYLWMAGGALLGLQRGLTP